jgi:hypothetical protein
MTKLSTRTTVSSFIGTAFMHIVSAGSSFKVTINQLAIFGKTKAVVVPAGTLQADAFPLVAYDNICDTVGAGTGVILGEDAANYEVLVRNNHPTEPLNVYPKLGSLFIVNGVTYAVNAPFVIDPYGVFTFKIYTAQIVRVF